MSPEMKLNIGLPSYEIIDQESKNGNAVFLVRPKNDSRPKGRYQRRVRHLDCLGDPSVLVVNTHRYECLDCQRSFYPALPDILKYRHSSEAFRRFIYEQHHFGVPCSTLFERQGIGQASIERFYQEFTIRKASERLSQTYPQYLGIDEHTLHKGKRLVTTFCDLKNHRVFELFQGRSSSDLSTFLSQLKGREQVKMVCIDLSSTYRAIVKKWFPNAKIVADRFHVVRVIFQHFIKLATQILPEIKNHRGYLLCLRKNPKNLTQTQKKRLEHLFHLAPAIQPFYQNMHQLRDLMNLKHQKAKACRKHAYKLYEWIDKLQQSNFTQLITLAKTLDKWAEPIACMWRFTLSNGITEGFHRKMKLIQRRAFGFKNFQNYRLRVIAQCG